MARLSTRMTRIVPFVLIAAFIAGCGFSTVPAPQDAAPGDATATPPGVTSTSGASLDATPALPSPTPTATSMPAPEPIGFDNASQLQIISEYEDFDSRWEPISHALSPDGRFAAVAGCLLEGDDDKCHGTTFFRLFDVHNGAALLDPEYLSPAIEVLAFSPDGSVLAAAGCDISLWIYGELDTLCDLPRVWLIDTASGEMIAELTGYTSHVTDFAFSPDGATLFTSVIYLRNLGDGDHVIRAYDAHSGEKLSTTETGMINCTKMFLDMSPDGRYLVGNVTSPCEAQSFVAWWDVRDPSHPSLAGNVPSYGRSQVSPDSTQILVYNLLDHSLKVHDLETGSAVSLVPSLPGQSDLRNFIYLDDRESVLINLWDEYVIFDLAAGEIIQRILPPEDGVLTGYLLTPDRSTLFVVSLADDGCHVEVWDTATWQSTPLDIDQDYAWFWQEYYQSAPVAFVQDATALVGINTLYSFRVQTWGFADASQAQAAQVLRDYFDLLVGGDYEAAASMYIDEESARASLSGNPAFYTWYPVSYVQTVLTDMDFSDLPAVFEQLCQEPDFPCMPLRDILYQADVSDGLYRFTVTFALPDGSLADWTPCHSLPDDYYCTHRGGAFEYFVLRDSDGSFKVVEGLPPAIALFIE